MRSPCCVSVCVSHLLLLGNGTVKTFPWKQIHTQQYKIVLRVVIYEVRIVTKEGLCVRVSVCSSSLSLLRNGSVNTIQWQRMHMQQ
jgi:hypothetical protein